jgi:hypothetical protein
MTTLVIIVLVLKSEHTCITPLFCCAAPQQSARLLIPCTELSPHTKLDDGKQIVFIGPVTIPWSSTLFHCYLGCRDCLGSFKMCPVLFEGAVETSGACMCSNPLLWVHDPWPPGHLRVLVAIYLPQKQNSAYSCLLLISVFN